MNIYIRKNVSLILSIFIVIIFLSLDTCLKDLEHTGDTKQYH